MNKLYGGMDLHANNLVTVLVDEEDPVVKSDSRMIWGRCFYH